MAGTALHEAMWQGFIEDCVSLPCNIRFATDASILEGKKTIGVVGPLAALQEFGKAAKLPQSVQKTYDFLLTKLKPERKLDDASQFITEGAVEKLHVGAVSQLASRSTSPYRPDQVFQFTKRVPASASNALVIVLPAEEAFEAYTAAVARAHPLCKLTGDCDAFDASREALDVIVFRASGEQPDAKRIEQAQIVADSIQLTARLVDTPTNYLNTKTYAKIVEGLQKRFGFALDVIRGEELQAKGMNVIFSVGRAAEYSSALCVMSHTPAGAPADKVACWCGKGIVYDTGGLSLKPTTGMCGMKRDMGGSAGVLGGFIAAVRLGIPTQLHALLALADNAVNEKALRNDDVVRCLSGKTIEINNTDAEGRLVLCDAVAYAHKTFKPTVVVEMATLTGAQGVATGKHFAAVVANTEEAEVTTLKAGKAIGDQCAPLVFAPELLLEEFDSKIADMRNSVACRTNAQSSCAGLFIYEAAFAGKYDGTWVHIDMAYPVEVDGRGTGWGVALLTKLATELK